nr:putative ribonuclease H-like domain-containing protein [Tanacetum cinerariifolium]
VLAPRMYKIHTDHTQARTSKLPQDSKKTNKHVSFSTGVISTTSVSRPQLKSNPQRDRVLRRNSRGKKLEVEEPRRNVTLSKNETSVTARSDSLNAKNLNVKSVSAMCAKCVMIDKHDLYVPKSVAKPHRKTVASDSIKKPRNNARKLNERFGKIYKWSYIKFTPSGYMWKPTSKQANVNPNVSMPLGNASRTANVKDTMTYRHSIVSNTPLSSNSFAAHRDFSIHRSHGTDLYSITLQSTSSPNPISLMAKVTSSQAWLIQRGLQAQVRVVRTDKGTKFMNQTLHTYFAAEGIQHQTSVARTPEQNGVVERRNRTLVEAARTMLSAAKVPLFFWAEAIATACFTQNRSLVIHHHEKTPYHIINERKPSVKFFHIFGSVCYIVRDVENLDKMKEKGVECIFVGYSTQSRAYRVFNKRTRVIMESIHVNFDELPQMALAHNSSDPAPTCQKIASVQISSDPAPECQTMALEHDCLSPERKCQENVSHRDTKGTMSNELDLLFSPMFDELINGSSKVVSKSSAVYAADVPNQRQQPTIPLNNHSTHAHTCQTPTITPSVISSENINQAEPHAENDQVTDDEFINIFSTLTKDHPLEQVIGNPSQSVRTRRQLESDAEMCMFALTLTDYSFHFDKIPMYCDSKAAIAISCNPVHHSRTKYIDVRYHFIKEKVEKGIVELFFVGTEYQLADLFTKALPEERFKYLIRRLGMRCLTPKELEILENESA